MPHGSSLTRQILATAALLVWGLLPEELAWGVSLRIRETLRSDLMSRSDYARMEQGYYEQILDSGRNLGALGDASKAAPHKPRRINATAIEQYALVNTVPDVREWVLKPNIRVEHWGEQLTTNALGMRDRTYDAAKPAGTFRIAFVGDSIGCGWGVGDGQGFEPTVERWLDARSKAADGPAVEIHNFAVPGHGPGQRWEHFAKVGWSSQPDLVLYESTLADVGWDERRLRKLLSEGIGFDVPVYRETLMSAGARPGRSPEEYKRILRPRHWELLSGVFHRIVADCRARGVPCVWVLIPRVGKAVDVEEQRRLVELARRAGFSMVVDLSDTYAGIDPATLAIGPEDYHPNADGHARLARRIDAALQQHPDLRRLWDRPSAGGGPR